MASCIFYAQFSNNKLDYKRKRGSINPPDPRCPRGVPPIEGVVEVRFAKRAAPPRRARYFAFRGSKRERAQHRGAIAHLISPYPRRRPSARA